MSPGDLARLVLGAAAVVFVFIVFVSKKGRARLRRYRPGAGAIGAVYDMLNEDKRNAVELILEEKAEARDPERAHGNLPELERPRDRK